jgi:hypothetical protein
MVFSNLSVHSTVCGTNGVLKSGPRAKSIRHVVVHSNKKGEDSTDAAARIVRKLKLLSL